jgi:hypothetical protein
MTTKHKKKCDVCGAMVKRIYHPGMRCKGVCWSCRFTEMQRLIYEKS